MLNPEIRSTDEFNHQQFRPHGRADFVIEGRTLVCEAFGPFNKELIEAVIGIKTELIADMVRRGKWGAVIVIRNSALASSEVIDTFSANLRQLAAAGVAASAAAMVIARNVEGGALMQQHFVKAYTDAGLTLTVFEQLDEAKNWVAEQLGE